MYRRLGFAVAAVAALAIVGSASAAQPGALNYSSTFDSSSEGWFAYDGSNFNPATWQASNGNPGGYMTYNFPAGDGLFQSTGSGAGGTWNAGNALGDYGGTIGADLRVQVNTPTTTEDALIGFFSSNSNSLPCQDMGDPTALPPGWHTYTATLDTAHLIDCSTGSPLTAAQATAALAGFDAMFVIAGNTDNPANPETVDVDNAELTGPQAPVTPPTGAVTRLFLPMTYRAHKFQGILLAEDDYSCAGKTKVTIFRKAKKPVKVGTATTSAPNLQLPGGPTTFKFTLKKVVMGSYYASVTSAKSKLDGNTCSAVKSKLVKAH